MVGRTEGNDKVIRHGGGRDKRIYPHMVGRAEGDDKVIYPQMCFAKSVTICYQDSSQTWQMTW